jgi:beta-lactam-binding protein with PASTA domain
VFHDRPALRTWGWRLFKVGYALLILGIFPLTSYVAFSQFVRRGVTPVPDLVGLTLEEAEDLLMDQGLQLEWLEEGDRFDDKVPAGSILQHDPRGGGLVKKGSTVEVILSRGRQLVEVPDLKGQALQAAQVNLGAAGLAVGRLASVYATEGEPGTVVRQDPVAGTPVARSTPVNLLVSLENTLETFVMPDLVYRKFEEAREFFVRNGFRIGSVKYEPYEGIGLGTVLRQYPLAGHPLNRHDVISLVVAAAASPPPDGGGS